MSSASVARGLRFLALGSSLFTLACAPTPGPEAAPGESSSSIVVQAGFRHEVYVAGLNQPTAMDIAPDGRIFVAQQTGELRVVKSRTLLPAPFVTLTVDSVNERGLVGLTLDPHFADNGYVYVFYTTPQGGTHNRVSRFTAAGDVAAAGSEVVLVDFPALSDAGNHNSGALGFGKDGKLYVAHGDNADTARAQNLNDPFGKILRFNPDGTIPTDNPFFASSTGLARAIWAYGVRNTFTFAFQPGTGTFFGNDVGGGDPEEVNRIVRGANYGHGGGPAPVAPVYSYPRDDGRCAITGGTFYDPAVADFPPLYVGRYFFADYCAGKIWSMNPDGSGVALFASESNGDLGNPVDLDVGPDGALYFLQRGSGAKIGRIASNGSGCQSNAQCDDGNPCNGAEVCANSACSAGTPLTCDDGNACTTNTCLPTSGCSFPSNGTCAGTRFEAEASGFAGASVTVEAGASGGQYVDGAEGAHLTWTVSSPGGASVLRFAIRAPSGVRVMGVLVNGQKLGTITTTTLRPAWGDATVNATLVAGSNRIELVDSEGAAEPDIDYLEITGAAPSACGDGVCAGGETCGTCAADCGTCAGPPAPLLLTHVSDGGGWTSVAALTDGNLVDKVNTATNPNCIEYSLRAAATVTSARLLEDNAGAWNIGTWKVQVDSGHGFVDAVGYSDTPQAMPTWNVLDFPDVSGVTRVNVCFQGAGMLEAAELEVWGNENASPPICGDWQCNGSETCSSCPWDCDVCPGGQAGLDSRPANPGCLAGSSSQAPPALLSGSGCFVALGNPPTLAAAAIPYSIAEPFWSDGALKTRHVALPDGASFTVGADGDFVLPPGAVTIKSFEWLGKLVETRFFVRYQEGTYGAWTYAWNDEQTEATLVDPAAGASRTLLNGQIWSYPSRTQCFDCHSSAAGYSLGLETRQLNSDQTYRTTGRTANQLLTFKAIGLLPAATASLPPFPSHALDAVSLQMRAESYLHVNCSNCHRPGGPGYGTADYRYDTPFASKHVCNQGAILAAFPGLDLVEPGDHAASVVWLRMSQRNASFMPPIASAVPDAAGATLLETWIDGLTGCPAR
jgi:uncharacterized repeat protein (TIGR03806 family)